MKGRLKRALRQVAVRLARRIYAFTYDAVERDLPCFANSPRNLHIELPRRIFEPQCFHIGDDVHLGPGALMVAQTYYPTEMMSHPDLALRVQHFQPQITIGNRVTSTGGLTLAAMQAITIEDDVMLAGNVFISDGSHGLEHTDMPYKFQPMSRIAPVTIKRGCWIGQNVVVLPGVTIGEMAIIGANSVVTRDVPARSIAAGCPARILKRWDPDALVWRPAASSVVAD